MSQIELQKRLYIVAIDSIIAANKKTVFNMGKKDAFIFLNMAKK